MSTFLELCQQAAEESGTFPTLGVPETTVSQTDRLLRLVNMVRRSAYEIERSRSDWRWLVSEFSGSTVADTQTYAAAALGISERFSRWIHEDEQGHDTFSLYLPADGQGTEGYLRYTDWPQFRQVFMYGSAATQTGKPQNIAVNDARSLVLFRS